jgi:16S rRNA G1207 methylase RsmC
VGELLWAGVLLLGQEPPVSTARARESIHAERQSLQTSTAQIREAFSFQATWSPSRLGRHLSLTNYQLKTALRRLVDDGYLIVAGKTRGAVYSKADGANGTEEKPRLSA